MQISVVTAIPVHLDRSAALGEVVATCEPLGAASTGAATVSLVVDTVPDVVIVDDALADPSAPDVLAAIREQVPISRAVLLFADDDDKAYRSLAAGALAAIAHHADPILIAEAVRGVARGESVLAPGMAERLIVDVDRLGAQQGSVLAPTPSLTPTEREVLTRVAQGRTPADIAAMHAVSARLVNLHAGYAVAKLHHYELQRRRLREVSS